MQHPQFTKRHYADAQRPRLATYAVDDAFSSRSSQAALSTTADVEGHSLDWRF
jgi:hypothetical protein